jgi:hypothetical protein
MTLPRAKLIRFFGLLLVKILSNLMFYFSGHEGKNTLAYDFSMKLDGLLKTLGHAKPHFIRCIKVGKYGWITQDIGAC